MCKSFLMIVDRLLYCDAMLLCWIHWMSEGVFKWKSFMPLVYLNCFVFSSTCSFCSQLNSFSLPSKPSSKDLLCSCEMITYFETTTVFCFQVGLFDVLLSSLLICCCVCCFNDGQIVTDPLHGKCVDVCLLYNFFVPQHAFYFCQIICWTRMSFS